jgi:hypothetical protein
VTDPLILKFLMLLGAVVLSAVAPRIRCAEQLLSQGSGQHGRVLQERTGGVPGRHRSHASFVQVQHLLVA